MNFNAWSLMRSTLAAERPAATRRACALLSLLSALTLAACATSSPPVSVAPQKELKLPTPPAIAEPPPSGTYWQRHCEFRQSLQARLSVTLPKSEHCSEPGPGEAQPGQGRAQDAPAPAAAASR